MAPSRKITPKQLEMLVEFAESNKDIALGRSPGGPQAARITRELWVSIAIQLNSVAQGTTKSSDQWRRYWIEFKAKTKAKASDTRRRALTTGGGPYALAPLTDLERRVLAIVRPVGGKGLPGMCLPTDIEESSSATLPTSLDTLMEVEWLEEESPTPLEHQNSEEEIHLPPPSVVMQPADSLRLEPSRQSDQHSDDSIRDRSAQRSTPARRARSQTQRSARRSTLPQSNSTPSARRARAQRQISSDERAARWVYEIELRRIAAEERHAAAMEAMVELVRDIRDDVRTYLHRHTSP